MKVHKRKDRVLRNIRALFALRISLSALAMSIPIIVLFWMENGLSMFEILLLQSIYSVALTLLEVPSGYIADRLGRKKTLLAGASMNWLGIAVFCIADSFTDFLVVEMLLACGWSLLSGADQALLYDSLKEVRKEKEFERLLGECKKLESYAAAAFCIFGGYLAAANLRTPFYGAVIIQTFGVIAALMMHEPVRTVEKLHTGHFKELMSIAKYSFIDNQQIRWLLIMSAFIFAMFNAALWLYQPYFEECRIDREWFGWIFAAMNIVCGLASGKSHKLSRKLGEKSSMILMIVSIALSYILLGNIVFVGSFIFIMLQQFVRGYSHVTFSSQLNRLTCSDRRATILSILSMSNRLVYGIFLIPLGWVIDKHGLLASLNVTGAFIIIAGLGLMIMKPAAKLEKVIQ